MSDVLTRMRIALRADGIDKDRATSLLFWARSFLTFCNNDDPDRLDRNDVESFLTHVAEERFAGRPARDRVLEAIVWMFRSTPGEVPSWLKILIEERRQGNTPNTLSPDEVRRLLAHLTGTSWLAAALIYGTGIRLLECVRLRVRDIDLQHNRLTVRNSADEINRRLPLPENIQTRLHDHLEDLRLAHIRDIVNGTGSATLPPAVASRSPGVARNWGWQYLFPQRLEHERTGAPDHAPAKLIHHIDPQTLHRKFERAALEAGIYRRVTGHVLRNSFALQMIRQGLSVQQIERILGTRASKADDEARARSLPVPAGVATARGAAH
ncbi:MAG: tyrosine-type recombinase/integrase [Wenzhouxiangellaceae bacterium]